MNNLPDLVLRIIYHYLSCLDQIRLSMVSARLRRIFHQIKSQLSEKWSVCSKCHLDPIASRCGYYQYWKKFVRLLGNYYYTYDNVLPLIYDQDECPCQYSREFTINSVLPKMSEGQFIISLSSQTLRTPELGRGDYWGSDPGMYVIAALRYKGKLGENWHQLCLLGWPDQIQLTSGLEVCQDAMTIQRINWGAPMTISNLFDNWDYRPFDLRQLADYGEYLKGAYDPLE